MQKEALKILDPWKNNTNFPVKIYFTYFSTELIHNFHGKKEGHFFFFFFFFVFWGGVQKMFAIIFFLHQAPLQVFAQTTVLN